MSKDSNRLLLQLEPAIREPDQETINPVLPELSLAGLNPVMSIVAKTRANYLQALFGLAESGEGDGPDAGQIEKLRTLRQTFEEMVAGAQAIETAIQRGCLDVKPD
jgi:hypothetical protein